MSLQFIMGPSGSGKSHYLYEWVTKQSLQNPNKNYIVLVPEQFTMQTQKDLVMASSRKGILNVEVLSFHRLAQRVLEETGENGRMILSDVGKNFVIRKIASEQEAELKVFGGHLRKIGYISEIKSVISELTQYDIQPKLLEEWIENAEKNPALQNKLCDIKTIYENFQTYLKDKYITGEEVLDVLATVAHRSNLLKDSVIVMDGFTGFTPVQIKLLRVLLGVCEGLKVTVTMDAKENPFVYKHPYQLFALSKQMVTTLMREAKECGVIIEEPVYLYNKPVYRFQNNEPLAFLENHLFRYSQEIYEGEQENVQIWCAKSPQEEMDFVSQTIRRLVREGQCRYHDIAVLTKDMNAYANHIKRSFESYQIPVFLDHKRSILLNSFVEYVRSLLAMAEQNFSYESVFRYLRTNLTVLGQDEVDVLENYVVAMGIRGYKKWQTKWIRRTANLDEAQLEAVNQIRETFMNGIQDLVGVFKQKRKTVRDVTTALHEFFLREDLQKRVQVYQLKFEADGELALAKEYAQVYRLMIELLDQFVELLGDEPISMKEYCELLDAGLEEAKVGVIPPSIDQVMVGDVERSRLKDVKVVFLVGASDHFIPGEGNQNGLLSEYDRQFIIDQGALLAPGAKEKTYIQKFYLYLLLTKPTSQVYLTYSKTLADGKSTRPSYLIGEVKKYFADLKVQDVSDCLLNGEYTPQRGIHALVQGLQKRTRGLGSEWQELYTWYKKHPEWEGKIEQILEAAFYQKPESVLTKATAKLLYGDILENSVTRLEKFSRCPYVHFVEYGLQLQERQMYQFDALDMGNLFHSAIEKFSKKIKKEGYTWLNIPEAEQEELIEQSVEESIVDYGNSILYSSARHEYIISRLKRMMRRSVWALKKQLEKGDFVPESYELSFGGHSAWQMPDVDLGALGTLRLKGKIDRIDVCEDGDKLYIKVIDYKTGKQVFDWNQLCHGLQLQLVVYLNAAMEIQKQKYPDKQVVPAGLFYYLMKDPLVKKEADAQKREKAILGELCPNGVLQGDDTVVKHLDCDFTKYSQVIPVHKDTMLSEADFDVICRHVNGQVQKIGTKILEGKVETEPYELSKKTPCKYCSYRSICGFDEAIPGYTYRQLKELKYEDILDKMREEVEEWECNSHQISNE